MPNADLPRSGAGRRRWAFLAATVAAGFLVPPLVTGPADAAGPGCDLPIPLGDCTAPTTLITSHPAAETTATAAGFAFSVTSSEPMGVTFECKLEGPGQSGTYAGCTDPSFPMPSTTGSVSYTGLTVGGTYLFKVRATDPATNVEEPPQEWEWDVVPTDPGTEPDSDAPDTTITSGAERWHLAPYIGIDYQGDEALIDADCTLNGNPRDCNAESAVIFGLGPKDYTFTVAGIDQNGNEDPTPATEKWTVPYQSKALTLSSGWRKKSGHGYFQDSYVLTSTKGATAKLGHQGYKSAVLVATVGPRMGKVEVSLAGKVLKTVNLAATTKQKRQAIPLGSWSTARTGVIKVVVLSRDKDVVVEGIGFSARR